MKRTLAICLIQCATLASAQRPLGQNLDTTVSSDRLGKNIHLSEENRIALLQKRVDTLSAELAKAQNNINALIEYAKNSRVNSDNQWKITALHINESAEKNAVQDQRISALNDASKKAPPHSHAVRVASPSSPGGFLEGTTTSTDASK